MSRSKPKRGRYGNFYYREVPCNDLLSICEQGPSDVPDVEIDLFCSEPQLLEDDLWDEAASSKCKTPRTEPQCPSNTFAVTPTRTVPPNSPADLTYNQKSKANPFVNYLLRVWSEQKFNSPVVYFQHHRNETVVEAESPALVFEDPDVDQLSIAESNRKEQSQEGADEDYHIVPDFESMSSSQIDEELGDMDDYDSQRSRILNSCVSADHIVPVRFLEE